MVLRCTSVNGVLNGIGDWKSELISAGKSVGVGAAKAGASYVGGKLKGKSKTSAPQASVGGSAGGLSRNAKLGIAAAAGLGLLLVLRRRGR